MQNNWMVLASIKVYIIIIYSIFIFLHILLFSPNDCTPKKMSLRGFYYEFFIRFVFWCELVCIVSKKKEIIKKKTNDLFNFMNETV